jgi:hypothetical protein
MAEKQPSFNDRTGPVEFNVRRDALVRENQIAIEYQNIVRERLADCARKEGVNQFVNCKELREQYLAICNDRFKGMIFPADSQPLNRKVPGLLTGPPVEFSS